MRSAFHDTRWARRQVLIHLILPDLADQLIHHPHRTWRESQLSLIEVSRHGTFWTSSPEEIYAYIASTIANTTHAEWRGERPDMITPHDQNNIVKMLCIRMGVYEDIESFRLPGAGQTRSILDDPTRWNDSLRVMMDVLSVRKRMKPEQSPQP